MNRRLKNIITGASIVLVLGCNQYEQVAKQTVTFANMQHIARWMQREVEAEGTMTEEVAMSLIRRYNDGRDAWGTPYIWKCRKDPAFSFIVVSLGSDRTLDVADYDEYFDMSETNIVGQLERDIVFRDGQHVTIASAK